MLFRRSKILSLKNLSVALLSVAVLNLGLVPGRAAEAEGELIAQDAQAQINVRSLANTEADIVAAGVVGDRVQILEHSTANDGLVWYRVKLQKSGASGWIRGDLIKVLGNAKAPAAQPNATKPPAPVSLTPPKPPASADSAAPKPEPAASDNPKPDKSPAKPSTKAAANNGATIVAFQTLTYAVRVFSESGQLRLNLYNRRTNKLALKGVPVEGKSVGDGTTYSYGSESKVTILVPASGAPSLTASAFGDTLKEQAEVDPPGAPAPP